MGPTAGLGTVKERNFLPLPETETQFLSCPACGQATIPTELSRLRLKTLG